MPLINKIQTHDDDIHSFLAVPQSMNHVTYTTQTSLVYILFDDNDNYASHCVSGYFDCHGHLIFHCFKTDKDGFSSTYLVESSIAQTIQARQSTGRLWIRLGGPLSQTVTAHFFHTWFFQQIFTNTIFRRRIVGRRLRVLRQLLFAVWLSASEWIGVAIARSIHRRHIVLVVSVLFPSCVTVHAHVVRIGSARVCATACYVDRLLSISCSTVAASKLGWVVAVRFTIAIGGRAAVCECAARICRECTCHFAFFVVNNWMELLEFEPV